MYVHVPRRIIYLSFTPSQLPCRVVCYPLIVGVAGMAMVFELGDLYFIFVHMHTREDEYNRPVLTLPAASGIEEEDQHIFCFRNE
jgi:hypothetical protein